MALTTATASGSAQFESGDCMNASDLEIVTREIRAKADHVLRNNYAGRPSDALRQKKRIAGRILEDLESANECLSVGTRQGHRYAMRALLRIGAAGQQLHWFDSAVTGKKSERQQREAAKRGAEAQRRSAKNTATLVNTTATALRNKQPRISRPTLVSNVARIADVSEKTVRRYLK